MSQAETKRPPFTPRNWPGFAGIGIMWLLGKTPQRIGLALSVPLGWLLFRLMKGRRSIAARNIERCYPEMDDRQRDALLRENFRSIARMIFEINWAWSASKRRVVGMSRCEGVENLFEAAEKGKGVLLLTAHMTSLELGGRVMAMSYPEASGIYRPLKSPVLEWYQNRSREQYSAGVISKRDMRGAIRFLRKGGVLWYAPDQDFGPKRSVFVPFFGIETATLEATWRLVKMTGCAVVPMFPRYNAAERRYEVAMLPALEISRDGEMTEILGRVNAMMEAQIRRAPEQYWWIHRRFKTRPEGEPPFYD